jgi:hypothetical protein
VIEQDAIESFNTRLTANLNNLQRLTPSQRDAVKNHGSRAEALLKNPDLAMFIHQFKFEVTDALGGINGHTSDDNSRRVALGNHLAGIDSFVASLQRAVYMKNRVVSEQDGPASPPDTTKKVYNP